MILPPVALQPLIWPYNVTKARKIFSYWVCLGMRRVDVHQKTYSTDRFFARDGHLRYLISLFDFKDRSQRNIVCMTIGRTSWFCRCVRHGRSIMNVSELGEYESADLGGGQGRWKNRSLGSNRLLRLWWTESLPAFSEFARIQGCPNQLISPQE